MSLSMEKRLSNSQSRTTNLNGRPTTLYILKKLDWPQNSGGGWVHGRGGGGEVCVGGGGGAPGLCTIF